VAAPLKGPGLNGAQPGEEAVTFKPFFTCFIYFNL